MANHDRFRLQGFAAPASKEGWQQRAIDRVRDRQRQKKRHNERSNGMYLFFDDGLRVLLDEACFRRDISLTGYGRRAMIAMIAHDLGLPLEEVAQHAATPAGYGATGGGRLKRTHDDGRGKGPWRILKLGE
jgi:hypothetical protein